jgi:hypothetical protein
MQAKENIYEELKSSLIRKNQQVSSLSAVTPRLDNKQKDVRDLNVIFDNIISRREAMFSKFDDLYGWKTNVLETMLSTFVAGYYSSEIDKNVNDIILSFDLFYIINSPEFVSVFDSFMLEFSNVSPVGFNASTSISLKIKQNFFRVELENYVAKILPDIEISALADEVLNYQNDIERFYLDNNLEITSSKLSEKQYKLIFLLAMLSADKTDGKPIPKVSNSVSYISEIAQLKTEIDQTGIYNTDEELFNSINKVKDLLKSFLLVETYREENDAAYYADGTQSLNDYFSEFNEQLSSITDIASLYREGVINFSLVEFIVNTNEKIKTTIVNIFDQAAESIQVLDSFAENYEPFLEKQTLLNDTISNSLKIIENIDEKFDEETALTTTITSVEDLFDQKKKDFEFATGFKHIFGGSSSYMRSSEWAQRINLVTKGVNISDSLMLYTTLQMRNINGFMDQVEVFNKALNYSLTSLIQEGVAYTESIKEDFLAVIEKERNIFNTFGVKISNNINNEKIPSTLKSLLKGLEIIDLISFDDYLENLSISLDATKTQAQKDAALAYLNDFRKKISFIILEEFAKAKEDINIIIPKIVDSFKTAKSNFKTIILEIEIKKAFENIFGYIDSKLSFDQTTGRLLSNGTVLANETILLLKDFLISTKSSIDALQNIAKDYKDVWNFFYNNNKLDEDIVDIALKDEDSWDDGENYEIAPKEDTVWFNQEKRTIYKYGEPSWRLAGNINVEKPLLPAIGDFYFNKETGIKEVAYLANIVNSINNISNDIGYIPLNVDFIEGINTNNESLLILLNEYRTSELYPLGQDIYTHPVLFFAEKIKSIVNVYFPEQSSTTIVVKKITTLDINIFYDKYARKLFIKENNVFVEKSILILINDPNLNSIALDPDQEYEWFNSAANTYNKLTRRIQWKEIGFLEADVEDEYYTKYNLNTGERYRLKVNNPTQTVEVDIIEGKALAELPFSTSNRIDGGILNGLFTPSFRNEFNKLDNTYILNTETKEVLLIVQEYSKGFFNLFPGYRVKYIGIDTLPKYFYDTPTKTLYTLIGNEWIAELVPNAKLVREPGQTGVLKWYTDRKLFIDSFDISWGTIVSRFDTKPFSPARINDEYIDKNGNIFRYKSDIEKVEEVKYFNFKINNIDLIAFLNSAENVIIETIENFRSKFKPGDRWYEAVVEETTPPLNGIPTISKFKIGEVWYQVKPLENKVLIVNFKQTLRNLLKRNK